MNNTPLFNLLCCFVKGGKFFNDRNELYPILKKQEMNELRVELKEPSSFCLFVFEALNSVMRIRGFLMLKSATVRS